MPALVLCFTYRHIAVTLWQRRMPGNAEDARDAQYLRSKVKASIWDNLRRYRRIQITRQRLLGRMYEIDEKLRIFINLIEIAEVLTMLSRTRALSIAVNR